MSKSKFKGTTVFPHTATEAYVVKLDVEKKNLLSTENRTIFIETPFSEAKRVGLLAVLVAFNLVNTQGEYENILKGLIDGRAVSFVDDEANIYSLKNTTYLLEDGDIEKAKSSDAYYSFVQIMSPFYDLIGKNGAVSYIYTPTFLRFRNYDEEFAAMLGAINEIIMQGQKQFVETHYAFIIDTINLVHLMGYPHRPMIASA